MARRSPKPATQTARRTRKTTPPAETPPVVPAPAVSAAPKSQDPKKANIELWVRAKAEAHAEIAALSLHLCACGCGRTTKNTFCPGHDSILQSRRANELFQQLLQHGDTDNASPLGLPSPATEHIDEPDEAADDLPEAE